MPRLENIVAHIANQFNTKTGEVGTDALRLINFTDALGSRSTDLGEKEMTSGLTAEEAKEREQINAFYEVLNSFIEKEQDLKRALDAEQKDRKVIRDTMREVTKLSQQVDNLYSRFRTNFPNSLSEEQFQPFDNVWSKDTFDDSQAMLDTINSYTKSRIALALENQDNEVKQPIAARRGNRRELWGNSRVNPADLIDEAAKPEESSIISMEDIDTKWRDPFNRYQAPNDLRYLSSQLQQASRIMEDMPQTNQEPTGLTIMGLSDAEEELHLNLGKKLLDYSNALDYISSKDPQCNQERFEENLKKVSTLPAFLGQRNKTNQKTNYELIADVLKKDPFGSQDLLDSTLTRAGEALHMDMRVRQLNPDYEYKASKLLDTPTPGGEYLIDLSTNPEDPISDMRIYLNPKEDLATELAKTSFRAPNQNPNPSEAQIRKRANTFKKMPMYKKQAKNPSRMVEILKNKNYSRTLEAFENPFLSCPVEKKKEVLEKLKMLKETDGAFDPVRGRSAKWVSLMNSLDNIDTSDPSTYDNQLKNILTHTEAHMKGKKAISWRDNGINRRFEQDVNILGILAQAGPFAKDRANVLVDRTNYIRTRWWRNDPTISVETSELPLVGRINEDYNQIKQAEHDPYKRNQLKGFYNFDNYSMLQNIPDTKQHKNVQPNLNNNLNP